MGDIDACIRQNNLQQITKLMTYIVWRNLAAGRANQSRSVTYKCMSELHSAAGYKYVHTMQQNN